MTLIKIAATVAVLAIAHAAAAQENSGANPSAVNDSWQFPELTLNDLNLQYKPEDTVHFPMIDQYVQALYADAVASGGFAGTLEEFVDAFWRSQIANAQVTQICSSDCGTYLPYDYNPWVISPNH